MAYDPNLWAPADLPGQARFPQTQDGFVNAVYMSLNRIQAQNSRVVKLLNRFRLVMDADKPDATGSGFTWIDTTDGRIYYDDPSADPHAWLSANTFFNDDFTVWDDVRVAAEATKPGSSAPTWTNITGNVSCFQFANSQANFVEFSCQLPHSYKLGSDIHPHIHWGPEDATSGNVRWLLTYSWADIGEAFSGSTDIGVTGAASGTANDHQVAEFSAIDGTGMGISSMLLCKLQRRGSNALDTYTGAANFYEFDFHIEIDSVGSDEEYVK